MFARISASNVKPGRALALRAGFTLIELVVIAIIAILIGLLLVAIFPILREGPKTVDLNDLRQLDTAVQNFKLKFDRYPPSRLVLCNDRSQYNTGNQLHVDSLQFLNQMFPRLDWTSGIDWTRTGTPTALPAPVTLEGDQCLVFFLGGLPTTTGGNGCLGFSTNAKNPTQLGGDRIGPFYEFKSARLAQRGIPFFSYKNPHDAAQPYVYFSSYNRANGYNRYGSSDCASLGLAPYAENAGAGRYHNPNRYQIISAGEDGLFGPGGQWTPATAQSIALAGKDDISNFYESALGVSP